MTEQTNIKETSLDKSNRTVPKVLFSWIGTQDYLALDTKSHGPIFSSIKYHEFEEVILLHDKNINNEKYVSWLKMNSSVKVSSFKVDLKDPTDFEVIYKSCKKVISSYNENNNDLSDFYFLVSAGTWAMASVWIIISQKDFPATLLKADRISDSIMEVKIPFEVSVHWHEEKAKENDEVITAMRDNFIKFSQNGFLWKSESMLRLLKTSMKIASRELSVFIEGEPGTEKEVLARILHEGSARSKNSFIKLDCNLSPDKEIEEFLIGLNKNESHSHGTVYINAIEKLSLRNQGILYSLIKDFEKNSGIKNPRILTSSNITVGQLFHLESFDNSLLHSISMMILKIPALRHRKIDLNEYLDQSISFACSEIFGEKSGIKKTLSPAAKNFLLNYNWKGNMDELYSAMTRMVILSESNLVNESDALSSVFMNHDQDKDQKKILNRSLENGINLNSLFSEVAQHYIPRALDISNGNKKKAADILGLQSQQTLANWIDRYLK